MNKRSVVSIILAAGASRRMGQPKQLLPYQGQTLLSHVIQCLLAAPCSAVVVVLGANADEIEPSIERFPVKTVRNPDWSQGISSSIRCGVEYTREQIFDFFSMDGMIFVVCDQPFISTQIIEQLIGCYNKQNQSIIACHYNETIGTPVLFDRSFYSELVNLKGDQGAKKIIQKYRDQVATIRFPDGEIDLDTFSEYQQFVSESLHLSGHS